MPSLDEDISRVVSAKGKSDPNEFHWTLEVHTPETEFQVEQLVSVEIIKDYANKLTDTYVVEFNMGMGDYTYVVNPHYNELEGVLECRDKEKVIFSCRMQMIILNNEGGLNNSKYTNIDQKELNKVQMVLVRAELVYREVLELRKILVDGICSRTTVKDVLLTMWHQKASQVEVEGKELEIDIDIVDPANTTTYNNIDIPTGTNLVTLGHYLQEAEDFYGVYNGHYNNYVSIVKDKFTVYIYPLYDENRFDNEERKLTIYQSDNPQLNYAENVHLLYADGNIDFVANTNTVDTDSGQKPMNLKGTGFINTNPVQSLQLGGDTRITGKGDKTKAEVACDKESGRITTNRGYDSKLGNRFNYVGNTNNPYKVASTYHKNSFQIIQIQWPFANPIILTPGMPVCYKTVSGGEIVERKGVLQYAHYFYKETSKTMTGQLVIAVDKSQLNRASDES